jgi:thiosulfate/3-mercaptopyruvate sulfurtransferase
VTVSALVSPAWLATRLDAPEVKVVDGSWYLPSMGRNEQTEYLAAHIPGAVRFPIDEVADLSTGLPHMLPDAATFSEAAGAMGLSETDTIVVYDGLGLFSAARVWWTFRVMGALDVRILDGGFPAWRVGDYPMENGDVHPAPATFHAIRNDSAVWTAERVRDREAGVQFVDLRPAARFSGEAEEPRAGLRSGHAPGSVNLPFSHLVENGRLRSAEEITGLVEGARINAGGRVVTSCGSGVTASIFNLALNEIGIEALDLYDGSWAEWGGRADLPVVSDVTVQSS